MASTFFRVDPSFTVGNLGWEDQLAVGLLVTYLQHGILLFSVYKALQYVA
jgi:hypothetical protein